MKYYSIVQFTVTNADWIAEYGENVTKMLEAWGGKYLARTYNIEVVEGEVAPQTTVVLVEWPSREAAISFTESEDYQPYKKARQEGSEGTLLLVPGEDTTEQAHL